MILHGKFGRTILIRREVMATGFAPVLEPEKKAQQPTTGQLTPINEIQAFLGSV